MEQNLKVIIESEQAFDDDTLINDPSFGENYFLTRQIVIIGMSGNLILVTPFINL